jgi:hypothetical protein
MDHRYGRVKWRPHGKRVRMPALLIAGLPSLAWSLQRAKTAKSILSAPNHLPIK